MNRRNVLSGLAGSVALAWSLGARAATRPAATVRGVKLGITTGSLNPLPVEPGSDTLPKLLEQCRALGIWCVELSGGYFGPAVKGAAIGGQTPKESTPDYLQSRDEQRQWRLSQASLADFRRVRKAFAAARVNLFSISNTIADDCTDSEIDALFRQMRTLGVQRFQSNQTRVTTALRLAPFAARYRITPAFHTHAATDNPEEIASVASLEKLLAASPAFRVCLDIGHFTAGNNDAVDYLRTRHARISHLHFKDRKRNNGPNVAWGTGDTPIAECLRLVRDNAWNIPCLVEREFRGTRSPFEETVANLDYMRDILRA